MDQLIRFCILPGLCINGSTNRFCILPGLCIEGLSPESVSSATQQYLEAGDIYKSLTAFVKNQVLFNHLAPPLIYFKMSIAIVSNRVFIFN